MEFTLTKIDGTSSDFNCYRGIKVLTALSNKFWKEEHERKNKNRVDSNSNNNNKEYKYDNPIHLVSYVSNHVIVSFNDGSEFIVFDKVPKQLLLDQTTQNKLDKFILNQVNDYFKNILAVR